MFVPTLLTPTNYIGTSAELMYTSTDVTTIIKEMILANISASSAWVRIHLVPNGGAVGNDNVIFPGNPGGEIPPGAMVLFKFSTVMAVDSMLYAICETASAVTFTASGVVIQ